MVLSSYPTRMYVFVYASGCVNMYGYNSMSTVGDKSASVYIYVRIYACCAEHLQQYRAVLYTNWVVVPIQLSCYVYSVQLTMYSADGVYKELHHINSLSLEIGDEQHRSNISSLLRHWPPFSWGTYLLTVTNIKALTANWYEWQLAYASVYK